MSQMSANVFRTAWAKAIRFPLKAIPKNAIIPVLSGGLRGTLWIKGSGVNGYWLGFYEKDKQRTFSKMIKEGDTVLDIGAHVGFYTLLASKLIGRAGKVYSFEPFPKNADFLRRHLELNRIKNASLIEAAVGDQNGEIYFSEGENTSVGHVAENGFKVRCVSLDAFCKDKGIHPSLMKIDVEGFGANVLKGGEWVIREYHPKILFAIHNDEERNSLKFLKKEGYKFTGMDGEIETASEILALP